MLAYLAAGMGTSRPFSCTDVAGADDFILTAADVATLDAQATAMNSTLRSVAQSKGWAFADISALFDAAMTARGAYRSTAELGCTSPYGQYISLDGLHPNVAGHQVIASIVAESVNAKYGFALPTAKPTGVAAAQLCP